MSSENVLRGAVCHMRKLCPSHPVLVALVAADGSGVARAYKRPGWAFRWAEQALQGAFVSAVVYLADSGDWVWWFEGEWERV